MTGPSYPGERPAPRGAPAADSAAEVEHYLRRHIPLAAAMGLTVHAASASRVELRAPLAPNVNPSETAFGGSAAALAMLAAWTLLHVRRSAGGAGTTLVIQHSAMSYERPITGDFEALCELTDESSYERFLRTLERHGRARITLHALVLQDGARMASFTGDFVALRAG